MVGIKKDLELVLTKRGVITLTLYAFSTENWKRSKIEVEFERMTKKILSILKI